MNRVHIDPNDTTRFTVLSPCNVTWCQLDEPAVNACFGYQRGFRTKVGASPDQHTESAPSVHRVLSSLEFTDITVCLHNFAPLLACARVIVTVSQCCNMWQVK